MNKPITLKLATQTSYIYQVVESLKGLSNYIREKGYEQTLYVVVDEYVLQLHEVYLKEMLDVPNLHIHWYKVPRGELSKSFKQYKQLCGWLLKNKIRRNTPVIAIGGGVVGDLAGFTASTALRGVPLIHIPTTLLAMVDSSIGGKTGINHETGKNLIGSFYQPDAIWADTTFLETLESKEWVNGISEMLKYAAIEAPEIFEKLNLAAYNHGFKPDSSWHQLICQCAGIKADIVEQDEKEAGIRAYLNFGHTFGHALENIAEYGTYSHGEAVYAGMLAASYFAEKLGYTVNPEKLLEFKSLYNIDLSQFIHDKSRLNALTTAMHYDKKIRNDQIRLILLKKWGRPFVHTVRDEKLLYESWEFACHHLSTS